MPGVLSILAGLVGALFKLPVTDAVDVAATGTSTATAAFNSDGTYSCAGATSGVSESGNWVTPVLAAPGSFTIRCHVNSGTTPTGSAVDTDLALTSNRSWISTRSTAGTTTCNVTLTLKNGAGDTLKTTTITISAQTII